MALSSSTGPLDLHASRPLDTNLGSGHSPDPGHPYGPRWQQEPYMSIQTLAVIGSWTQTRPLAAHGNHRRSAQDVAKVFGSPYSWLHAKRVSSHVKASASDFGFSFFRAGTVLYLGIVPLGKNETAQLPASHQWQSEGQRSKSSSQTS